MCPRSRSLGGFWPDGNDPYNLIQAFHLLDRDGDGAINGHDLSSFFGGCIGKSISAEEASSMIALADLDGDGAVGLDEFQSLMSSGGGGGALLEKQRQEAEQAALRQVFEVLDVNKDGQLGVADLGAAMAMSGYPLSEQELDAMWDAAAWCHLPASPPSMDFDAFFKFMCTHL